MVPYESKGTTNFSIHAEKAAIMSVKRKSILKDCVLFVVRIGPDDESLMSSVPCDRCKNLINKVNIEKTYFSKDDNSQ